MLLQARGRMSAPALAQALEVSERTIARDIDQLSAAGVPVWGERGRQGGFQLRSGWSTELTGLTQPEVSALFLAGLDGPATELGLGTAATSARLKVIAGLPAEWREQASRVAQRLHIDAIDWFRAAETPALLREAAAAVWAAQPIAVRYQSWRGVSERTLHPLGIVLKAGTWYLVAQSAHSQRIATYRLANVQALEVLDGGFKRPSGFDLADYWARSIARFERELQQLHASVRVSPRGLIWLTNARIKSLPCSLDEGLGADGWQTLMIPLESLEHGARQLLAFGTEIEVLAPVELRRLLAQTALAVHRCHRDDPNRD